MKSQPPSDPERERAKDELASRGLPFSEEYFLRSVRSGKPEVVLIYLRAGISPDAMLDGESALAISVNSGNKAITKLLLEAGAYPAGILEGLKSGTRPKDAWERLGSMTGVFAFVSSLLIAGVGWYFTQSYNSRQLALAEAQASADKENKFYQNRLAEMQTVEKMIPHLTKDEASKKAALIAISALASPQLAARMAEAYGGQGSIDAMAQLAKADAENTAAPAIAALTNIASRETESDKPAHTALAGVLEGKEKAIARILLNGKVVCNGLVIETRRRWVVAPTYCIGSQQSASIAVQLTDGARMNVKERRTSTDGLLTFLKLDIDAPSAFLISTTPVTRGSTVSQIAFDLAAGSLRVVLGQVVEAGNIPFFKSYPGGISTATGFRVRLDSQKLVAGAGGGPLLDSEGKLACMTFQSDREGNEQCLDARLIESALAGVPAN